ncbi:MAG: hypothetical protein QF569_25965 [Candidatus Poribacteria bacterium]|nr:hypothetical protein [Candidatus Poribacteria bacterium]
MIIIERHDVISKHNLFLLWLTLSLSICHLVETKNKRPDWVLNYGPNDHFLFDAIDEMLEGVAIEFYDKI